MPNTQTLLAPQVAADDPKGFFKNLGLGIANTAPQGLLGLLQNHQMNQKEKKENKSLRKLTGHDFSEISPEMKKVFVQNLLSQQQKQQDKEGIKQIAFDSISHMRDILDQGRSGYTLKGLSPQGLADRSALDTAALSLERLAAEMVGKGTMSQTRFNFLKERLPSSWKTDEQNKAILDEWERIIGGHEDSDKSNKKSLSREEASKLLKEAGNDANKARKLARERGYEF